MAVRRGADRRRAQLLGLHHPAGRPAARRAGVGVVVDDTLYHGGGAATRKARNLATNPHVTLHLESGDEVVIVEGVVEQLTEADGDPELLRRIDDAYEAKYGMRHGTPVWALRPRTAFGWDDYPMSVTRWDFDPPALP